MFNYYLYLIASVYIPLAASVAGLILGIIVLSVKVRPTKILGLGIIFSSLSGLLSATYNLLLRYGYLELIARTGTARSAAVFIFSLAVYFCISFYIHKNYGKKFIYIPLMLIPLAGRIASTTTSMLINKTGNVNSAMPFMLSISSNTYTLLINAAVSIILIAVFYKNRKIEKIIPHTFIFYIIELGWTVISQGYNIIVYVIMSIPVRSSPIALSSSSVFLNRAQNVMLFFSVIGVLIGLILPIYLTVMALKASRKTETE